MTPNEFTENLKNIKQYYALTGIKDDRHKLMSDCIEELIPGICLEFGVFQGSTINYCSSKREDMDFYGFDSFVGLPEAWREHHPAGHFNNFGQLPSVNKNVKLIKGWFSDTLEQFLEEHSEDISFIHMDCDIYSSTKFVLNLLKNRIKVGTIILFDEFYNYPGWNTETGFASGDYSDSGHGEFKAWFEFLSNNPNLKFEWIGCNIDSEQVAVKITSI